MHAPDDIVALLARIPLFQSLPRDEVVALASLFRRQRYAKGESIIYHEEPGSGFFVVKTGSVKVTRPIATGEEAIIDSLGSGEFFGEMALLDGRPRSASVAALEPTQVIVLYRADFIDFLHSHPVAMREIIVVLADRIRRLNDRVEDLVYRDLPARLARLLLQWVEERGEAAEDGIHVHIPMTQAELAGMVGVSRQHLNRQLRQWQEQGILEPQRRQRMRIIKPEFLKQLED